MTNPFTIGGVVLVLFLWTIGSGASLGVRTGRLVSALDGARSRVEEAEDERAFFDRFENSVGRVQEKDKRLGSAWSAFQKDAPAQRKPRSLPFLLSSRGVVRPSSPPSGRPRRALSLGDAEPLGRGGAAFQRLCGLAVALGEAGGIVGEGVSDAQRNASLHGLLDAASFKFITSLAGLFLSIAYALYQKKRLRRVDRALDGFNRALEHRAPPISAVALQQAANDIAERQATQFETFSNQLAVNIGAAFDAAFDQRLGEHIKPLTEAMQQLASGMASRTEDTMAENVDRFLAGLRGGASDRMNEVATSLAGLGQRLEGMQSSLGDAARHMAEAADQMARRMGEGAEFALGRITDQVGGLAESLRGRPSRRVRPGRTPGVSSPSGSSRPRSPSSSPPVQWARAWGDAEALERRMGEEAAASAARLSGQFETTPASCAPSPRRAGPAARRRSGRSRPASRRRRKGSRRVRPRWARCWPERRPIPAARSAGSAEEAVARIAVATEGMERALLRARRIPPDDGQRQHRAARRGRGRRGNLAGRADGSGQELAQASAPRRAASRWRLRAPPRR